MTIFYDPQTKKSKVWIIAAFILVPIFVLAGVWVYGQQAVQKKNAQQQTQEQDIFKRNF